MKNEEWELHFLLGKREEGKIALTQLLNEECRMKNEEWELLFLFVKREEGKIALTQWTRWWRDGTDGAGYIFSIFRTAEQ